MNRVKLLPILSLLSVAGSAFAQAPVWDKSGNGLLNGTYYFRDVIYQASTTTGNLSRALAIYGNISFDGNGNYTLQGAQVLDSQAGAAQSLTNSGTYSIAGSGYGFLSNPLASATNTFSVSVLVSNGLVVGSDTEDGFNDLFVAAPVSSPLATTSSFHGSYSMVGYLPNDGTGTNAADVSFQLNPDGAGNLGTVNINGYFGGAGSKVYSQSTAAVKYFFSNGAAVLNFPNSSSANFYSGQEYLYMSADGNFVFGGSPQDFDFFIGVRTPAVNTTQNFGGLYYEAGLDNDASNLSANGYSDFDTFYGSFNASGGVLTGHQRLLDAFSATAEGFTYAANYPTSITAPFTSSSGSIQYTVSNNGAIRIGQGIGPYLGINVAVQAPALTGSGVFLNPAGVVNAASFAPFTAGISPGELIVLYGTNLAAGTQVAKALPFPNQLGNVQVTINGLPAPIYYVSPSQISVIVPYGITYSIGQIQVTNDGTPSNSVTALVNKTTPGVFTVAENGIGYGSITHANGTIVSPNSPAQPGEGVAVYISGLGAVFPPVPEGQPGPSSTLSNTTNTITAFVGGITAPVTYAGLAPYLAGLYQVNVTIPSTATSGDNVIDISGPDSDAAQAVISVGTASSTAASTSTAQVKRARPGKTPHAVTRPAPCFVIDSACSAR